MTFTGVAAKSSTSSMMFTRIVPLLVAFALSPGPRESPSPSPTPSPAPSPTPSPEALAAGEPRGFTVPEISNPHPRLFLNASEIATIRERIRNAEEPWYSLSERLRQMADEALAENPKPSAPVHSLRYHEALTEDGRKAQALALAWQLFQDPRYLEGSKRYLMAWAGHQPMPGTNLDASLRHCTGMDAARGILPFTDAYDLIAPEMDQQESKAVQAWFLAQVDSIKTDLFGWVNNDYYGRQYFNNHFAAHTMGLMAIGYAVGDRGLVQWAVDSEENPRDFKDLLNGLIYAEGEAPQEGSRSPDPKTGEIVDRYRTYEKPGKGLAYAHLSLTLMTLSAEMAARNGMDFFAATGAKGENLLQAYEFYAPIFAKRDPSLQGGFHAEEPFFNSPSSWYAAIYEIGHTRYPESEPIREVLRAYDRTSIPSHPHVYLLLPGLTHGSPLPEQVQPPAPSTSSAARGGQPAVN